MVPNIYSGNYKLLALAPLALIIASLAIVLYFSPVERGIDFRGGILADLQYSKDAQLKFSSPADLEAEFAARGFADAQVRQFENPLGKVVEVELSRDANLSRAEELKSSFFAKADDVSKLEADMLVSNDSASKEKYESARKEIAAWAGEIFAIAGETKDISNMSINQMKKEVMNAYTFLNDGYKEKLTGSFVELVGQYDSISFQEISATLSTKFFDKIVLVSVTSVLLTTVAVFFIFRTAVPSLAVLSGAVSDIIIALGAMGLFHIPLTLPSFAALLMLVGFSLDTDVLLTMRVIKHREGHARDRAFDSMKTGLTMSIAALVAFGSLFVLAYLTHINTYYEISSVAIAGLVGDMFATWGIDGVLVLGYMESRERREQEGKGRNEKSVFSSIFRS